MGPGGGEFYSGDNSLYNVSELGIPTLEGHDEVTSGALHHQPSTPELATTAYDVFGRWDTLGVRFLTDHLNGDVYFRVHRPDHNAQRCRAQFRLATLMLEQLDRMREIIAAAGLAARAAS